MVGQLGNGVLRESNIFSLRPQSDKYLFVFPTNNSTLKLSVQVDRILGTKGFDLKRVENTVEKVA